ncbi:hypothetical protein MBLNU459_g1662t2 [Dothideomycetes sp. NU459]
MEGIIAKLMSDSSPRELRQHLDLVRSVDWAATPIGIHLNSWPSEIAWVFHLAMLDPQPRLLLLGPENTMIYNVAHSLSIGEIHPRALGSNFADIWIDVLPAVKHSFVEMDNTGLAHGESLHNVMIMRNGLRESCHISFLTIPLPSTSSIRGYSSSIVDVTDTVVANDRASNLSILSDACGKATTLETLWQNCLKFFHDRPYHFPLAAIYTSTAAANSEPAAKPEISQKYQLRGSVGDFDHDDSLPTILDPTSDVDPLSKCLREAIISKEPVLLRTEDGSLPEALSQACCNRGFGDKCSTAIVVPVRSYLSLKVRGFLILGASTRTPWNDAYKGWVMEVARTTGEAATSIVVSEEEARKEQQAAEALAAREKEANNVSSRLQRLVNIMERSDVGVFECSIDGKLSWATSAWYSLAGYPQDTSSEEYSWLPYVFEEDRELAMVNWALLLQGIPKTYELRWKRPNGEGHWVLAVCLPVLDKNGAVISISGCLTDISVQKGVELDALKRAEVLERARASEQRFTHFMDNAPMATSIVEYPSMRLSYVNLHWFDITGHEKTTADKIDWATVVQEEDQPLVQRVCDSVAATEKAETFQLRMREMYTAPDGKRYRRWVEWTISPEYADDGTTVRALTACGNNISHLKWAEEAQRSRVEEALEAKRQQEKFVDTVSHELRNPLGAVVHCADAISDNLADISTIVEQTCDEKARSAMQELIASSVEAVQTITACSAHQKRIVDDLLTLSKLDSNLLQINHSAVRVRSVIYDVYRMFKTEAQRVGVTITVREDESIQGIDWVALDSGRVQQILINLVTNAIKFTKSKPSNETRSVSISMGRSKVRPSENALPVRVDFTLARGLRDCVYDTGEINSNADKGFYLWFCVTDTGRGMSETESAKLFTRFSQGSVRTYSDYGGSGLGLYISRHLSELQGGEIGVASELGIGSTFAFYVKSQTSQPTTPGIELPLLLRRGSVKPTENGEATVTVLVTEDNLVNQRVLSKQLTKNGYRVYTADNGQQALDFVKQTRHWTNGPTDAKELHVILMDIEMPVMNGITATKTIRDLQKSGDICNHIPIIAVSANARSEQTHQAIVAGMDDSIMLSPASPGRAAAAAAAATLGIPPDVDMDSIETTTLAGGARTPAASGFWDSPTPVEGTVLEEGLAKTVDLPTRDDHGWRRIVRGFTPS